MEGKIFHYDHGESWREKVQKTIRENGWDVSVDELREIFLEGQAYAMFIVGATFPHLIQGSEAEESVQAWFEVKK